MRRPGVGVRERLVIWAGSAPGIGAGPIADRGNKDTWTRLTVGAARAKAGDNQHGPALEA